MGKFITKKIVEIIKKKDEQVNTMAEDLEKHDWYSDIMYYIKNLSCPPHLVEHQERGLNIKDNKYYLIQDGLGWKHPNGVILQCVGEDGSKAILHKFHVGYCGGHYPAQNTMHKILREGYY